MMGMMIGYMYALLFGFILPMSVVAIAFRVAGRKREMRNRERLAAIEKGLDFALIEPPRPNRQTSSRAGAIVLIAVGIGVAVALGVFVSEPVWAFGLIPGLIGLGLLAHWFTGGKREWERQQALDEERQRAYIDLMRRIGPAAQPTSATPSERLST
jgi:Domain of unknown function (DUF6249)